VTVLDLLTREAVVRPESYDTNAHTVEAVISTGAAVVRRDHRGPYRESLDLTRIDPATLGDLPLLDSHRQQGGRDVIGRVVRAWHADGAIVALVRLSSAPDVEPIAHRVREGTLNAFSIGYVVRKWAEGVDPQTGERTRTATDWSIHEVSIVPIGADPNARRRNHEVTELTEDNIDRGALRGQIRAIARQAGLTADWADEMIDQDQDITQVRAAAFQEMQSRGTTIRVHAGPSNDDPAVILERRTEALAARVNGTTPPDSARQFMGESLRDMVRGQLALRGVSTVGMDTDALIRAGMHTTSDFPQLLTGVGNRTLMPAYQAAQSPLKRLARQALHTDFRKASKLRLGEMGPLAKVNEAGEIKHTTRGASEESYALDTYGSLFALSRKAIINDDLGAFRDFGVAAGRAAAETEAALLASLLTQSSGAGPVMGEDAKRLFHADHGNLAATGTALGVAGLSAGRLAMRTMKGLDGRTPIAATPKFVVVGPALETTAEQILTAIAAATSSDVNPFGGKLELLVEPRLPAGSWYLFADPAVLPVLEYAYLSSAQGPQMASREGWDVLAVEFRVVLDFGAGAVDWRGAYRNPGL
jgi:phage head maturation protease